MLFIPLKVQEYVIGHLSIDTETLLNFLSQEGRRELLEFSKNLALIIEDKKAQQYLGESFLDCLMEEKA